MTATAAALAGLSVQVQELAKDVAKVEKAIESHERLHQAEAERRMTSRRWIFGAAVALVAAVDGPVVTVLLAIHR